MGMSDLQFEVYNALITFVDELIDREKDEKEYGTHRVIKGFTLFFVYAAAIFIPSVFISQTFFQIRFHFSQRD